MWRGEIVSLNIITLRKFNLIHLDSSNGVAAAAKSLYRVTTAERWRGTKSETISMCLFYAAPAKWTFRFRPGRDRNKKPGRRGKLHCNRCWDTGRQLYFNLLGEYTNNQFRLWRRADAVFLLFTAIHRCWCRVLRERKKVHGVAICFITLAMEN